jgi:hypothetical protein
MQKARHDNAAEHRLAAACGVARPDTYSAPRIGKTHLTLSHVARHELSGPRPQVQSERSRCIRRTCTARCCCSPVVERERATAFPNGEVARLRNSRVRAVAPKRVVSDTDGCDGWDHSICRRRIDWGQKAGTCSSRPSRLPSLSSPMTSRWVVLALVTYRVIQTVGPLRGSDPAGSCLRACCRIAAAPSNPPSPMDSTAVLGTSISAPFSLSPS